MVSKKEYSKAIGINIRNKRKELGITISELAFKLKIEPKQLGRIERGEINTTLYSFYSICQALNTRTEEIISINSANEE